MKTFCCVTFLLLLITSILPAQPNIPVNLFTGSPSVSIPFGSIQDHDLIDNIGLSYNTKGVSIKSSSGYYGTGWGLYGGGRITREVRGLPDDYKSGNRGGWLFDNNNGSILNFNDNADLSASTCADELTAFNDIVAFNYLKDTEPDLFFYDLPGTSGSFVFDHSGNIKLIPFADIKIEPTFVSQIDKKIIGFRITTNNGNIYKLNTSSQETKTVRKTTQASQSEFWNTEYELYKAGVSYNHEWVLDEMESVTGAKLFYTYEDLSYPSKYGYEPDYTVSAKVRHPDNVAEEYITKLQYARKMSNSVKRLLSISSTSGQRIELTYKVLNSENSNDKGSLVNVSFFDARRNTTLTKVKEFLLEYSAIGCGTIVDNCSPPGLDDAPGYVDYNAHKRFFLQFVTERSGADYYPPYEFFYYDTDLYAGTSILPNPSTLSIDFWGYYNGSQNSTLTPIVYVYPQLSPQHRYRVFPIPNYTGEFYTLAGANRTVNPQFIKVGALNVVKFPSGGRAILELEPNEFFDATANTSYMGGGLRVKSVSFEDGINPSVTSIRYYEYSDDNGLSSGRISYMPSYAVPMGKYLHPLTNSYLDKDALLAQSLNPWLYLTLRLDVDQAPSSSVAYRQVKVKNAGSGYVINRYSLPATWDAPAQGEWTPSINKFVRSSNCPSLFGLSQGSAFIYPYSPNPNASHQQGLLEKQSVFGESNVLVSETTNTYQTLYATGTSAEKIFGLRYNRLPHENDVIYYSKYFLLAGMATVISSQTTIVHDENTPSKKLTTRTDYYHESTHHRYLNRTKTTNSDGSFNTTYFKYAADYIIPTGTTDRQSQMIAQLQQQFRKAQLIETYNTSQKSGETEKVIGARLLKFNNFNLNKPLLEHEFALQPQVISNFSPASVHSTSGVFNHDSRYELQRTKLEYTADYNLPVTEVGQDKVIRSQLYGFNKTVPIASLTHAKPTEVAFSDFDSESGREFQGLSSLNRSTGRDGTIGISPSATLHKVLDKTSNRYILSGWLKNPGVAVNVVLKFQNTGKTTTYITRSYSLTPKNDFTYFEFEVPFPTVVGQFYAEIQFSYAGSSTQLVLDDLLLYPIHAHVTTYSHVFPYGVSGITSKGETGKTIYDGLGRVKYVSGLDGDIIEKKEYTFKEPYRSKLIAYFETIPYLTKGKTVTVEASENIIEGATYYWTFDGTAVSGSRIVTHTFSTIGEKEIRLRVSKGGETIVFSRKVQSGTVILD